MATALFAGSLFGSSALAQAPFGYTGPPRVEPGFVSNPAIQPIQEFTSRPDPIPISPFDMPRYRPNGFSEDYPDYYHKGYYFAAGVSVLRRARMGHSTLAIRETPPGGDTGIPPAEGFPEALNFKDILPDFNTVPKLVIGYHDECSAVELTGFYGIRSQSATLTTEPGRLAVPFGLFPIPADFTFNNNLWLQADLVREELRTQFGSLELNYYGWIGPSVQWIGGLRYFYLQETFKVFTDDEGLTAPNVLGQALYTVRTQSNLVGPQLGFELGQLLVPWLAIGATAKGTLAANFTDARFSLVRGDGFVGPNATRNAVIFSQLYEASFFLDFMIWKNARIRTGFQILGAAGMPEPQAQINFDLNNLVGTRDYNGNILFYGPLLEVQINY